MAIIPNDPVKCPDCKRRRKGNAKHFTQIDEEKKAIAQHHIDEAMVGGL